MFNDVKSGIYVKIVKNSLVCFEPFVNSPSQDNIFRNEFSINNNILNGGFSEFFTKMFNDNSKHNLSTIDWYIDNVVLKKYKEYDLWSENQIYMYKIILKELCQKSLIPDCEFFINRDKYPCLPFDNKKYLPVLSTCSNKLFKDVPIPSTIDVMLCYNNFTILPWESRLDTLYFRGVMPSDSVTENTSQRQILMDL